MGKPDCSLVIVLAEDARHQGLIRKYLYRCGYEPHNIRMEALPSGRGCGEQWVRERYLEQVKAFRRRAASAATALIVAIDADTRKVSDRIRQLQRALSEAQETPRTDREAIVHLIPKRNVETWVLCLSGSLVDEETDYKGDDDVPRRITAAAANLFALARGTAVPPQSSIPSLRQAIPEIRRLDCVIVR